MKQIKIFDDGYCEKRINRWIKENNQIKVIDIRLNNAMVANEEGDTLTRYIGYVIYEEKK